MGSIVKKSVVVGALLCGIGLGFDVEPGWAQQFKEESTSRFSMIYTYYSEGVELGDIDNDGDIDIVFANGEGYSSKGAAQKNEVFINDGKGNFADETNTRLAGIPARRTRDVLLADIDNDGDLDMVEANVFGDAHRMLINNGKGFFKDETATWLPTITDYGSDVDAADLNNDGWLDLYFTSTGTKVFGGAGGQDIVLVNTGTTFVNETATRLPQVLVSETLGIEFVDVDMDLDLDIYLTNRGPKNQLYLNDGAGHFTDVSKQIPDDGDMSYESVLGDLDGDLVMDVFVANFGPGSGFNEGVARNNGTGVFTDKTKEWFAPSSNIGADDNAAVLVDYDADGDLDVIVAALSPGYERLYENNGTGYLTLTPGVIQVQTDSTLECAVGDVDGNGTYDLISANGESGTMKNKLYINYGPPDITAPKILQVRDLAEADPGDPGIVITNVTDDVMQDTPMRLNVTLVVNPGVDDTVIPMMWVGGTFYRAVLPNSGVTYQVVAQDRQKNQVTSPVYAWEDNSGGEDVGEPPQDTVGGEDIFPADAGGAGDVGGADDVSVPEEIVQDVVETPDVAGDVGGPDTAIDSSEPDAAIPPVDTSVGDANTLPDGGTADQQTADTGGTGSEDTAGGSDTTTAADSAATDTSSGGKKSNSDDGCSTTGSGPGPGWAVVLLGMVAVLVMRRSRVPFSGPSGRM